MVWLRGKRGRRGLRRAARASYIPRTAARSARLPRRAAEIVRVAAIPGLRRRPFGHPWSKLRSLRVVLPRLSRPGGQACFGDLLAEHAHRTASQNARQDEASKCHQRSGLDQRAQRGRPRRPCRGRTRRGPSAPVARRGSCRCRAPRRTRRQCRRRHRACTSRRDAGGRRPRPLGRPGGRGDRRAGARAARADRACRARCQPAAVPALVSTGPKPSSTGATALVSPTIT